MIDPKNLALEGFAPGASQIVKALEGEISDAVVHATGDLPTVIVVPPTASVQAGATHRRRGAPVPVVVEVFGWLPTVRVVACPEAGIGIDCLVSVNVLPVVYLGTRAPRDAARISRASARVRRDTRWRRAG